MGFDASLAARFVRDPALTAVAISAHDGDYRETRGSITTTLSLEQPWGQSCQDVFEDPEDLLANAGLTVIGSSTDLVVSRNDAAS